MAANAVRFLVCASLLGLLGCGSVNSISGKVTYKGKALSAGTIMFVSSSDPKKKEFTGIGVDGTYKLIEPPQGPVKVAVEVKVPPKDTTTTGKGVPTLPSNKIEVLPIPPQYADAAKSGLTFDIKSGSNTYDIDLK